MKEAKPLLGFGWMGWVLLLVAAALVVVLVTGYDLRYQLQSLVMRLFGGDAVMRFTVELVVYLLLTWPASTVFNPVGLCGVLIAMKIHPRRIRWYWWLGIVVLEFVTPSAFYHGISAIRDNLPTFLGLEQLYLFMMLVSGLLLAGVLSCAFRSWVVLIGVVALTFLTGLFMYGYFWRSGVDGIGNLSYTWRMIERSVRWGWSPALFALLLFVAIRARINERQPWQCQACGYDLRKLGAGVCPECGAAVDAVSGGVAQRQLD